MRNVIGSKGFVSDLFRAPNQLIIDTDPSAEGGLLFRNKKLLPDTIVWVETVNDFPEPISGTIYLDSSKNYMISTHVSVGDLNFSVPNNVSFFGFGRNNTGIISTKSSSVLFSGSQGITIHYCGLQALGSGSSIFNISSVSTEEIILNSNKYISSSFGTVGPSNNVEITFNTFEHCSGGIVLNGQYDTVIIDSADVNNPQENFIFLEIKPNTEVVNRIRVNFSKFTIQSGQIGISASNASIIPVDGLQLFYNYFTGSGNFLVGLPVGTDATFFKGNIGVRDTFAIGQMTMRGNNVLTLLTQNIWAKVSGSTTGSTGTLLEKFTHATNRLTYTGTKQRIMRINALASLQGTAGVDFNIGVFKNQIVTSGSTFPISTDGAGNFINASINAIFTMATGDFVEFFVQNIQNNSDVTVSDLNFIVSEM